MYEDIPEQRTRVWFLVALSLIVVIGGYFLIQWYQGGGGGIETIAPSESNSLGAPVINPPLQKYEEIAQYTKGKPVPPPLGAERFMRPKDKEGFHVRGDANASVTLIEYAGFSSSYAKLLHPKLIEFLEANKETMNWGFRHFPNGKLTIDYTAAQATECVAEQLGDDGFWRYVDVLMAEKSLSDKVVYADVRRVGGDASKVQQCVESKKFRAFVSLYKRHAQTEVQIRISPSFVFMNNKSKQVLVVEGINTVEYLQQVLDKVAGWNTPTASPPSP